MTQGTFDLAVIGTGIIGATAMALASAREPDASIVGVCAGVLHDSTTSRSLAVDIPSGREPAQRELVTWSRELHGLLHAPAWHQHRRETYWLMPESMISDVRAQLVGDRLTRCEDGDRDRLRRVFGERLADRDVVLLRSEPASLSFPVMAVRHLVRSLLQRPSNLLVEGFPVRRIESRRGTVRLVAVDGGVLTARRVVAAPGAFALSGPFRETSLMYGARTKKIVAYRLRSRPCPARPLLNIEEFDAFLLPEHTGADWRMSITSGDWDCPPEHGRLAADASDRAGAEQILSEVLPDFQATIVGDQVGADVYLPDRVPLVVPLGDHDGCVLATGGAGSGFRLAPAIADQALDLLGVRNRTHRRARPVLSSGKTPSPCSPIPPAEPGTRR